MKIFSWNVNGIRAIINKGEFQNFISKYKPDVFCLQETKAKQGQAEIDLPEYTEIWSSADKPGYAGTAIFTKFKVLSFANNITEEIAAKFNLNDNYGNLNNEGRITTAELDDFFLVSVYTPNSKGDLSRLKIREKGWDPAFLEYILSLENKKPVIFMGDLNVAHQEIDLAHPKPNKGKHGFTDEERTGFQKFIDAGFIDSFRNLHPNKKDAYTWWTHWANARYKNIGWRIDYVMISPKIKIKYANIHPEQTGSDHCPISIEI
jgi:exodeoxyribonuclease-3